jgi:hypothetical protein
LSIKRLRQARKFMPGHFQLTAEGFIVDDKPRKVLKNPKSLRGPVQIGIHEAKRDRRHPPAILPQPYGRICLVTAPQQNADASARCTRTPYE